MRNKEPDVIENFSCGHDDSILGKNIWLPEGVLPGFNEACQDFYWVIVFYTSQRKQDHGICGLAADYGPCPCRRNATTSRSRSSKPSPSDSGYPRTTSQSFTRAETSRSDSCTTPACSRRSLSTGRCPGSARTPTSAASRCSSRTTSAGSRLSIPTAPGSSW
ncbi:hypothetical protein L226DRAFT_332266 [Lentinus tigrinus ALCF2SS1-7]|uniref:uncharacterized protein n=1 Tax=Lentinus tigrinus ALCF2SS1-7 TaxID=1328758 RepID=UPI0011660081|nr:hypothetical protein L226DRAFT_332266 [Lentinus tigrinus ALCF2SS1-7]